MLVPFGEPDLEAVGVDVDANREDMDALDARYGRVAIEEAMESASLVFGSLRAGALEGSRNSMSEALLVVMKASGCSADDQKERIVALTLPPSRHPGPYDVQSQIQIAATQDIILRGLGV